MTTKSILAISGNDIFSGGGLHADLTTFTVNQLHGFLSVTCLTAVTDKGFEVFPIDEAVFTYQLESLKSIDFSAIKIGLLPNIEIATRTLDFIKQVVATPIVLDPVLVCKEKHDLEVSALRDELIKLFPYVAVITPNLIEAQLLSQMEIMSIEEMKLAAQKLYDFGAKHVVIKGGNRLFSDRAVDLYYDGEVYQFFEADVLDKVNNGAGCTFSSSIASLLAQGLSVKAAVPKAKDFVYQAIKAADQYGVKQNYEK